LTQEAVAGLLGVERSTVTRWERGERAPQPWLRPKLARVLHVSADRLEELLEGDGPAGSARGPEAGPREDPPVTVPRQLPPAVADFTGRTAELETLTRILGSAGTGAPGTVVVAAIGGTPGVGKTALAVHWAHRVAGRFGDGQLYANLRGFDPSGAPVTAPEALRGFLAALGVPPDRVPPALDAQAALYRGMLADRKALIVLDNARDEQQIRPLLPATPGNLVIVTSRNQLSGLAAADGARLLSLDVLSHGEAVQLLTARLGPDRAASDPDAVDEIAALCACLPLALAVAAARAVARPGFPLAALAAELHDAADRLDPFDDVDPAASVRAVFSWSYQQLSREAARMFRLLGLHPGPDITTSAAASLAATSEPEARRVLRELTRDCLITEHLPARYAFHDLLRAYAAAQASGCDSGNDRAAATTRFLDHYLHTACAASDLLQPLRSPAKPALVSPGVVPEQLADYKQAMAWFEAEHHVLLAAIAHAAGSGFHRHAWRLPWAMSDYLDRRGHWHEWAAAQRTALAAATRLGDVAGQAVSRCLLGSACFRTGDDHQAGAHLRLSLELCQLLGDRFGEARIHIVLARIAERRDRLADALGHYERALELFQAVGDPTAQAHVLNYIGWVHGLLGDYQQAHTFSQRSLTVGAAIGDRDGEACARRTLGYTEHQLGNFTAAATSYERALSIFREFGDRLNQARTLGNIGDTRHAAGEHSQARDAWQQALAILEDLRHPDAGEVRAKLASPEGQSWR
jgi:tetratricopeptide (TPR) repeat protein/transcriptional regulator with XRE-family HTH domain